MVYATTEEFLKYIGIESLDKLPDIDNLQIDKKSKENIEEQINIDEQIKSSSI